MSYVPAFESYVAHGANKANETNRVKKTWAPPVGYTTYEDDSQTIGISFTRNGEAPMYGHFFKSSGKWRTNLDELSATTYYLYGYIPHISGISCSITDCDGTNTGYSSGAIMTLSNVPTVMANDLCTVIGAKDGTDEETVTGLRSGAFAYTAKATSGVDSKGNYVFLLFDHLYASLRLRIRVHENYDNLRTIKLKRLQLQTKADDTPNKKKTTIAITLKATDGSNPSESPITDITFTPTGEDMDDGIVFWSSAGETLTTDFSLYVGHFMTKDISKLVLTSTYDVYDKKGNLVRPDCQARNTLVMEDVFSGQATARRGCSYTVNMTIKPTFLHVMSDPDLDNPNVVVD